ncbi:MAG: TIGR01841 family phasin [Burkholderiaceae bacterium]
MSAIPEQVLARQKAAVNTIVAAQSALFGGFEKLVELNVKVMRATLDEFNQQAQQTAAVKDPQEAMAYASSAVTPGAEKAVAYSKHVYDIVTGVQGQLAKLQEAQIAETQAQTADFLDQIAKNAPAGSESAVAALKTTVANANSAYDALSKAAKQAADVAETNLNAATNATFKAASDAADAANKVGARARRTSA